LEKKVSTSTEMLCKNLPIEFKAFFDHVKGLRFDDRPDYDYLKRLFRDLFRYALNDATCDTSMLVLPLQTYAYTHTHTPPTPTYTYTYYPL
jgi:hypothetical protein